MFGNSSPCKDFNEHFDYLQKQLFLQTNDSDNAIPTYFYVNSRPKTQNFFKFTKNKEKRSRNSY